MEWIRRLLAFVFASNSIPNSFDREDAEPVFVAIKRDDPDLAQATQEAQSTLRGFLEAFEAGRYSSEAYVVKGLFVGDDENDRAHIWVFVEEVLDNAVRCSPIQIPTGFSGIREGQMIDIPFSEVEDWMLNVDGLIYGGFTIRVARQRIAKEELADHDAHIGLKAFSNELP